MRICMYGASSDNIDPVFIKGGEELGREIARNGHTLIYGGGGTGLMGACARGVTAGKGTVIGIIPYFMENYEGIYTKCTELIKIRTMAGRKELMEKMADAFVIAPGGIGTMDEFFQILTLTELDQKTCPIVIFNINGIYDDILSFIDMGIEKGFIHKRVHSLYMVERTAKGVLRAVSSMVG